MLLSGHDLAGFLKRRQWEQIKTLGSAPRLVDFQVGSDAATTAYVRAKQAYGRDIGATVEHVQLPADQAAIIDRIKLHNDDRSVHGIIVQLPLPKSIDTDKLIAAITPSKDVDGLGEASPFDPVTPTAILWLLNHYNIDYKDQNVVIVGRGRLVGEPLAPMMTDSGAKVQTADVDTSDLAQLTKSADIVITATGQPGLIKPGMVNDGAVVIDAGTALVSGKVVGDVDPALLEDQSLKVTPTPGGVGPLTVAVLFDHLILAAQTSSQ